MPLVLNAAAGDDGRRLDRILRKGLPDTPLSLIHRLLRKGRILVDGKPAAADLRIRSGQIITVPLDGKIEEENNHKGHKEERDTNFVSFVVNDPSSLPPLILFENADFLVLNKPAGLAVHGDDSLDTLVQAYLGPKIPPSLSFRPGPLHRLDKPTSGVIVFSASLGGAQYFSALLRSRSLAKGYLALVEGVIEKEGVWEDDLVRDHDRQKTLITKRGQAPSVIAAETQKGRPTPMQAAAGAQHARTRFKPLRVKPPYTLLQLELDTGRTHQIRAQAAAHGHALAADRKYGSRQSGELLLHAWFLESPANTGPCLPRRIEAPLPERFRDKIREIWGEGVPLSPGSSFQ
ncbi:pseudouridine synthase [Spirochaetia bacterium]|nr:pseudouridine synthase [Spirochaetia bacterium]